MSFKVVKLFNKIDTVVGHCFHCEEETVLVALVEDFYRCTNCGEDTKQYINGNIRYIKLSEDDKEWLKRNRPSV
mgnify:CR=1 FL=1|tara:strand:- start:2473 stop:2694 length:222 start_codon:yes stop_codon:yes gene_type:complete